MVGTATVEVAPYLALTRPWWGETGGLRRTTAEWQALLDDMSPVQSLVHMAGRMGADDQERIADQIFDSARTAYRDAIQEEINKWGCAGLSAVVPEAGPELSALRARADWAAESIVGTYNYELAREIVAIGKQVPTANRHVYAYRLFYMEGSWDGGYWQDKATEVAQIETMTAINAAIADFYFRNDLEPQMVMIEPQVAVCDICKAMVDGNPWDSVEEVNRLFVFQPHPGCPHHLDVVSGGQRLSPQQCFDLWVGV